MLIRVRDNTLFGSRNINRQIVFLLQPGAQGKFPKFQWGELLPNSPTWKCNVYKQKGGVASPPWQPERGYTSKVCVGWKFKLYQT